MTSNRKRVQLSLSPEAYAALKSAADAAGMAVTTYAAQIIATHVDLTLRPAHNPTLTGATWRCLWCNHKWRYDGHPMECPMCGEEEFSKLD